MKRTGRMSLAITLGVLGLAVPASTLKAADGATDQVNNGKKLYAQHCQSCHGGSGQGGKHAPPVVGKDALPLDPPAHAKVRTTKFENAGDVLDFISKNMPAKKPASLKETEYLAILAFDLKANGVERSGPALDAATARTIVLHQ